MARCAVWSTYSGACVRGEGGGQPAVLEEVEEGRAHLGRDEERLPADGADDVHLRRVPARVERQPGGFELEEREERRGREDARRLLRGRALLGLLGVALALLLCLCAVALQGGEATSAVSTVLGGLRQAVRRREGTERGDEDYLVLVEQPRLLDSSPEHHSCPCIPSASPPTELPGESRAIEWSRRRRVEEGEGDSGRRGRTMVAFEKYLWVGAGAGLAAWRCRSGGTRTRSSEPSPRRRRRTSPSLYPCLAVPVVLLQPLVPPSDKSRPASSSRSHFAPRPPPPRPDSTSPASPQQRCGPACPSSARSASQASSAGPTRQRPSCPWSRASSSSSTSCARATAAPPC